LETVSNSLSRQIAEKTEKVNRYRLVYITLHYASYDVSCRGKFNQVGGVASRSKRCKANKIIGYNH
jgi:hypothetical protein